MSPNGEEQNSPDDSDLAATADSVGPTVGPNSSVLQQPEAISDAGMAVYVLLRSLPAWEVEAIVDALEVGEDDERGEE